MQDHLNKIFSEGELDETDLTLRDLRAIGNAFSRVLTIIFHHRIEYPNSPVDYPTALAGDSTQRLRKVHDDQDAKSNETKDPPGGVEEDTSSHPPRLKIT